MLVVCAQTVPEGASLDAVVSAAVVKLSLCACRVACFLVIKCVIDRCV